jgi:hypothetical protein
MEIFRTAFLELLTRDEREPAADLRPALLRYVYDLLKPIQYHSHTSEFNVVPKARYSSNFTTID